MEQAIRFQPATTVAPEPADFVVKGEGAQVAALFAALSAAQAKVENSRKSGTNPHLRSDYSNLADVWAACRAALTENGLSVTQFPAPGREAGEIGLRSLVAHRDGAYIESLYFGKVQKDDMQGRGSAITYLRRYALAAIASVCSADDDGHAASAPVPVEELPKASVTKLKRRLNKAAKEGGLAALQQEKAKLSAPSKRWLAENPEYTAELVEIAKQAGGGE